MRFKSNPKFKVMLWRLDNTSKLMPRITMQPLHLVAQITARLNWIKIHRRFLNSFPFYEGHYIQARQFLIQKDDLY